MRFIFAAALLGATNAIKLGGQPDGHAPEIKIDHENADTKVMKSLAKEEEEAAKEGEEAEPAKEESSGE